MERSIIIAGKKIIQFVFLGFDEETYKNSIYPIIDSDLIKIWDDICLSPIFSSLNPKFRKIFIVNSEYDQNKDEKMDITEEDFQYLLDATQSPQNCALQGGNVIAISNLFIKNECIHNICSLFSTLTHELVHMAEDNFCVGKPAQYIYANLTREQKTYFDVQVTTIFKCIRENQYAFYTLCDYIGSSGLQDEHERLAYCVEAYIIVKYQGYVELTKKIEQPLKEITRFISNSLK